MYAKNRLSQSADRPCVSTLQNPQQRAVGGQTTPHFSGSALPRGGRGPGHVGVVLLPPEQH